MSLVSHRAGLWWLDSAGGLMLSIFVMLTWLPNTSEHVRNLSGQAATADERNVLLYLTMRVVKPSSMYKTSMRTQLAT